MNKLLFITPVDIKNFEKITSKLGNIKVTFKNPKKDMDIKFIKKNIKTLIY